MSPKDIVFDENLEFYTKSSITGNDICVILSDDLNASEETLEEEYKHKIANFINNYNIWYKKTIEKIETWALSQYGHNPKSNEIKLMNIFILFEQQEKELYGLEFRVEFDIEHGCGLKISPNNLKIIEIGNGDVAFC